MLGCTVLDLSHPVADPRALGIRTQEHADDRQGQYHTHVAAEGRGIALRWRS